MKGKPVAMPEIHAMREAARRPGVVQQLREMGRELDQSPEFVSEMMERLDRVIKGSSSNHNH